MKYKNSKVSNALSKFSLCSETISLPKVGVIALEREFANDVNMFVARLNT